LKPAYRDNETQCSPQVVGSDVQLLAGKEEEVGAVDNRVVIDTLVHLMYNTFEYVSEALHEIEQTHLTWPAGIVQYPLLLPVDEVTLNAFSCAIKTLSSSRRLAGFHERHVGGIELRHKDTRQIFELRDVATKYSHVAVVVGHVLAGSVVGNLDVVARGGELSPVGR
jgi:hypothetical protein